MMSYLSLFSKVPCTKIGPYIEQSVNSLTRMTSKIWSLNCLYFSSLPPVEVINYPNDLSRKWNHYQKLRVSIVSSKRYFSGGGGYGRQNFYKFILKKLLFKVLKNVFTTDLAVFTNWKTVNDVQRPLTGRWLQKWEWSQERTLTETRKVRTGMEWCTRSPQSRGTWVCSAVDGRAHAIFLA